MERPIFDNTQPTAETHKSITEINKFVTRIWEHPLLTNRTKETRKRAFEYVPTRLPNLKDVILVPVGSAIWISGEDSDVDFITLSTSNVSINHVGHIQAVLNENSTDERSDIPSLHAAGQRTLSSPFNFQRDIHLLGLLFTTPDEYILGDKQLARKMRIQSLDQDNYDGQERMNPHFTFAQAFIHEIELAFRKTKEWAGRDFTSPYDVRFPRFLDTLMTRSAQSADQRAYVNKYYKSLSAFYPPKNIDIYRTAMHATGGEIHIDARYIARGVESVTS